MDDSKRIFTLREAQSLLPQVQQLTHLAVASVEQVAAEMEVLPAGSARAQLQSDYETLVRGWMRDVLALGCVVKGLWLVDFDSGDGLYYCWQYPEEKLEYFHDYDAGFAGRRPLGPMLVS